MPTPFSLSLSPNTTQYTMTRVTLKSKLTVVSSRQSSGSGQSHRLSPLDHAMASHTLYAVFYYDYNPFGSFELDPLRLALSEVLTAFPGVTGRLARAEDDGNWEVRWNDAGVRVTMATVGATLDDWLRSADWMEERDLAAVEDMPNDPYIWSHFRLQINEFEGGGAAVGVSFSHLTTDPSSVAFLIKSWSDTRHGAPLPSPIFSLPSSSPDTHKPTSHYYSYKLSQPLPDPSVKMASITFKFSHSTISHSLSQLKPLCPSATPFDLLAALFWTRLARFHTRKTHSLTISTDFRRLFPPPHSERYFGNAQHFSTLSAPAEDMDRGGLAHVAGLLNRHLRRLSAGEVWSAVEWLESKREESGKYAPPVRMYGPELTCVCMDSGGVSGMYAAELGVGKGKPAHVSWNVGGGGGEGVVVVMPAREGGMARNVTVVVPEEEAVELREDKEIMSLRPTVVLSGRRGFV